jgi:hypothetical protein
MESDEEEKNSVNEFMQGFELPVTYEAQYEEEEDEID